MATEARGSFRSALSHRDFRWLVSGLTISGMGDWLYSVALLVWVFDETGSAAWVAAASIIRLVPSAIFGAVAGDLASRYDKRLVMIASDIVRAAMMLLVALVAAVSGHVALGLFLVFISTSVGTVYFPAMASLTPSLVGEEDLSAANAATSTIDTVALVVGPAIGGLLLLVGPVELGFAVNAFTFVVSALCISRIRTRATLYTDEEEPGFITRIAEGLRSIRQSREVSLLLLMETGSTFAYGQVLVLLVLVAEDLDMGDAGLGFMFAAAGAGGIAVAGLAARLADHPRLGTTLLLGSITFGLPFAGLAIVDVPALAYLLLGIVGAANVILVVVTNTMLQRLVRPDIVSRVFGVLDSLDVVGIILGSLLAPLLVEAFGLNTALIVAGLSLPLLTLVVLPYLRALNDASAVRLRELAPIVNRLELMPIFKGAPRPVLEALAGAAREQRFAGGAVVIRQGDAADDLFLVRAGTLDVVDERAARGPKIVNKLVEGDYFGEIGLIEQIPRTASVIATSDSSLYRVDGGQFLDIVNQAPALLGALRVGIASRTGGRRRPRVTRRSTEEANGEI
jgi:CRP-like cAMP-binding protein/predicted MFS family arabinose efflux permease